jgi:hypothetical protein
MVRMSTDPRTRNYVERRIKEGLSKKEIIRCLKRYVARRSITVSRGLTNNRSIPTSSPTSEASVSPS